MRQPRIKPAAEDTFHHCFNRIAGQPGYWPFGRVEKQQFIDIVRRLSRLYTVKVLAYQLMGNHYHLLLETPEPNLVAGMKWLQGTYTQRFNARHRRWATCFKDATRRFRCMRNKPAIGRRFPPIFI